MSRIVFFLLLGLGIFLLIRHYARKSQGTPRPSNTPTHDTIQCAQCKTYIPKTEAIALNDQFFCCKQHARDWTPPEK